MENLSHWDYTENFTGLETASLIVGTDPAKEKSTVCAPLLRRLNEAYTVTLWAHQDGKRHARNLVFSYFGDERVQGDMTNSAWYAPYKPSNLHSLRMTSHYDECFPNEGGRLADGLWDLSINRFDRWLEDDRLNGFHHQLFYRHEIVRWLEALGMNSIYRFEGSLTAQTSTPVRYAIPGRRDLLTPVIEQAQHLCRQKWDLAEVWAQLRSLAQKKCSPLIGSTEAGIQYLDVNDEAKNLSYSALRMRLARARLSTATHGN
jgi:hypothetical protein